MWLSKRGIVHNRVDCLQEHTLKGRQSQQENTVAQTVLYPVRDTWVSLTDRDEFLITLIVFLNYTRTRTHTHTHTHK